jgi:uncharacterized SAM-dependent methyltransferase
MQQEEQDFLDVFSNQSTGMYIKYANMLPCLVKKEDEWVAFINENKDYYYYHDEIELVEQSKARLGELVGENKNIVDFGPGLETAIIDKTMNALSGMSNIRSYTSLDIVQDYASNAVKIVRDKYPGLLTTAITADIMKQADLDQLAYFKHIENKAIISFNCMIHNISNELVDKFFENFTKLLSPSDLFVIGLDTNQDTVSLLKSYEGSQNMTLDILRFFKFKLQVPDFNPELFRVVPQVCDETSLELRSVKMIVVATHDQTFEFKGRKFEVRAGDEFYLWRSLRYKTEFIRNVGAKHGLELREVIQNAKNRVKFFVLVKV